MLMQIRLAKEQKDIQACQQLIAEVYYRYYGVTFSHDRVDPEACIESYPDRYLIGLVNGEMVAVTGLYVEQTYIERFGGVTNSEIDAMLQAAGVAERYSSRRKLEATKLVVRDGWTGHGIARKLHVAAQSVDFLQRDADQPYIITVCAKLSIFHHLYTEMGIRTRTIKPFPEYPAHERYRSPKDPMESRLIIPDLDIPPQWYNFRLPAELDLDRKTRRAPL